MLNFMANKKPIWDQMSQSEACNEHEFVCIITYRNLCSSRWTGQVSWCHGVLVNYDNYTLSYIRAVGRNTRNLTLSSTDLCVSEGRDCDSSWQVWSVMTYNWHYNIKSKISQKENIIFILCQSFLIVFIFPWLRQKAEQSSVELSRVVSVECL